MCDENVQIRSANENDLDAINQIIEQAVMGWQLPERVKELRNQELLKVQGEITLRKNAALIGTWRRPRTRSRP